MWDENEVLEMLKDMPQVLTDENLLKIQKLIDDNKYWHSSELQRDLCGTYAPFCRICDKSVLTPCAVAYVRMKIAEGMEIGMENVSEQCDAEALKEALAQDAEQPEPAEESAVSEEAAPAEESGAVEEGESETDGNGEEEPAEESADIGDSAETSEQAEEIIVESEERLEEPHKKIRIGIGYKKH